ncbi:hypothetical protein MTsDn1_22130 [Alteromonas sp. MTD1]|uniref:arsenate reductase/protein-tyrosine-phosphatase family protein n=1 Tax=Alteromonas sp. MTD1 TaxID=3057962 RepID=UPI0036F1A361
MTKALIIGEDTRSFLSVIRSLGRMGITVDVVCFDRTSPSLKSKFIREAYYYNYQNCEADEWITLVTKLINDGAYNLVFPCDERAIYPLVNAKREINRHTKLALPNKAVRDNLFDKNLTKKIAKQCEVRVAKGEIRSIENSTYKQLADEFSSKFVIKPTESFSENNLSSRNKVEIIDNADDYDKYLSKNDVSGLDFLIEEYFEGVGQGISVFSCQGVIQYMFAHTRVNEPRTGGGSSYRKAIPIDPSMAKACEAICRATSYDGVGMFEFKYNKTTNDWILVEVNARFWGSLPLALHAGVDFPRHYAEYLLGTYEVKTSYCAEYKIGALARSFSNDVYDIRAEMQHVAELEGKISAITGAIKRLSAFSRVLGNEKIDSYDKDDKLPFYNEFKQLASSTFLNKLAGKLPFNHDPEVLRRLHRLMYVTEGKGKIIFVCYGNIMRSPLAAEFSKIFVQNTELNFTVESFGFHLNENRTSPKICQSVAASLGIDLAAHRSRRLLQKHISDKDIIFIFDHHNQETLDKFYDAENVFNLAEFIPLGMGKYRAIDDPYGHGEEAVHKCYSLIIEALKAIFESYLRLK